MWHMGRLTKSLRRLCKIKLRGPRSGVLTGKILCRAGSCFTGGCWAGTVLAAAGGASRDLANGGSGEVSGTDGCFVAGADRSLANEGSGEESGHPPTDLEDGEGVKGAALSTGNSV